MTDSIEAVAHEHESLQRSSSPASPASVNHGSRRRDAAGLRAAVEFLWGFVEAEGCCFGSAPECGVRCAGRWLRRGAHQDREDDRVSRAGDLGDRRVECDVREAVGVDRAGEQRGEPAGVQAAAVHDAGAGGVHLWSDHVRGDSVPVDERREEDGGLPGGGRDRARN